MDMETFFVLYGKIQIIVNNKRKILNKGDLFTIQRGQKNFFKDISKTGSVIEELSIEYKKNDSFYVDKTINKLKKRKSFITLLN